MTHKYVYLFSEGDASMRNLLGGKGANLAEMTKLGLPVPQGFTITTEACTRYYDDDRQINADIQAQIDAAVLEMEKITGKKFGDKQNPLLVSVRSGARASMPGMMDTILNLGLNEEVVEIIAAKTGNERWARDCYRRFIQMYADVVMEVGKKYFEELIDRMKAARGVTQDVELTAADLKELAEQFKAEYKEKIGADFPEDPKEQLMGAIKAVFRSWDNPRANVYRRDNDIPYSWGTAVRRIRHRRRLYPRPGDRRKEADGRIPPERAGRRCRCRRAYPAADRGPCRGHAGGIRAVPKSLRYAGKALPRYAGHGIYDSGPQAFHAADQKRQANRQSRAEDRL